MLRTHLVLSDLTHMLKLLFNVLYQLNNNLFNFDAEYIYHQIKN